MRQYKSWIAALILGSTLSANAQQKNMENKTLNENIPEMIISLEKEALASTDPMAFVEHILQQGRGTDAVKGLYKTLEDLVWLTQLGLNLLLPLVLCLGGCWCNFLRQIIST